MVSLCGLPVSFRGFTLFSPAVSFCGLPVSCCGLVVRNGWNNHQNQPSLVQLTSTTDECNRIDDMIHIQFRSARLDLPGNTDAEAVIAILRSLQSL